MSSDSEQTRRDSTQLMKDLVEFLKAHPLEKGRSVVLGVADENGFFSTHKEDPVVTEALGSAHMECLYVNMVARYHASAYADVEVEVVDPGEPNPAPRKGTLQ